jgi:hypothetical protein
MNIYEQDNQWCYDRVTCNSIETYWFYGDGAVLIIIDIITM